jgi:hypothetical protein
MGKTPSAPMPNFFFAATVPLLPVLAKRPTSAALFYYTNP